MRFKKGSKVEVLSQMEVPLGSWWCATIVLGNGHNYYVSYDRYLPDMKASIERVPRKAIRPCPPLVESSRSWMAGDIVEVFDNSSWKLAEVSRPIDGNYFLVRILGIGSSREFRAHASDLRLRQSWHDDEWVLIGKNSGKSSKGMINRLPKNGRFSCQIPQACIEVNCGGENHIPIVDDRAFKELTQDFSRSMKKRPRVFSPLADDTCTGYAKKMRAPEKSGKSQPLVAVHATKLLEKGHCWRLVKLASIGPRLWWCLSSRLHCGPCDNVSI